MELCVGFVLSCYRRIVPLRPVAGCGALQRPGSCASLNGADCFVDARHGGRGKCHTKFASTAGNSELGISVNYGRFGVAPRPAHWARRGLALTVVRADEVGHGTEETTPEVAASVGEAPEVVNLGSPVTVDRTEFFKSPDFLVQLAIFLFAAGFVDAGFSGDWSRIGVLSKQIEEDLRTASIGVVPLSLILIWTISERRRIL